VATAIGFGRELVVERVCLENSLGKRILWDPKENMPAEDIVPILCFKNLLRSIGSMFFSFNILDTRSAYTTTHRGGQFLINLPQARLYLLLIYRVHYVEGYEVEE
jgi:hypothetical protein